MTLANKDRVKETSTTSGTGTYTLAGAVDGFQAFSAVGNGNTCHYAATDGTNWETGLGTYTAAGTTLARTAIFESSNGGAAVNWGAGSKTLFVTLPAVKASGGLAKAWLKMTTVSGTPTLSKNFNISSLTDNGVGDFTANFTVAFADTAYCCVWGDDMAVGTMQIRSLQVSAIATGSFRFITTDNAGTAEEDNHEYDALVFFGDQ